MENQFKPLLFPDTKDSELLEPSIRAFCETIVDGFIAHIKNPKVAYEILQLPFRQDLWLKFGMDADGTFLPHRKRRKLHTRRQLDGYAARFGLPAEAMYRIIRMPDEEVDEWFFSFYQSGFIDEFAWDVEWTVPLN